MALSPKQLRFCKEYMIDRNATQAAVRTGYSKKAAHVTGCRLLSNAKVKAEIAEREARQAMVADVTVGEVLGLLRTQAVDGSTRATELLGKHIGMWGEGGAQGDGWDDLTQEAAGGPGSED